MIWINNSLCIEKFSSITLSAIRCSLVGQDTRLSPERPGFKSRQRNNFFPSPSFLFFNSLSHFRHSNLNQKVSNPTHKDSVPYLPLSTRKSSNSNFFIASAATLIPYLQNYRFRFHKLRYASHASISIPFYFSLRY